MVCLGREEKENREKQRSPIFLINSYKYHKPPVCNSNGFQHIPTYTNIYQKFPTASQQRPNNYQQRPNNYQQLPTGFQQLPTGFQQLPTFANRIPSISINFQQFPTISNNSQ
jgi:hypothetical protein